jgi:hypothetical protein
VQDRWDQRWDEMRAHDSGHEEATRAVRGDGGAVRVLRPMEDW